LEHPTTALLELNADAQTALHQYGDFRSAVMLAFTVSEVLLDATLMAMAWEDGIPPEQAARLFSNQLMTRVRTLYHVRLGGNWDTRSGGSPVGRWHTACVLLRHRVAHAGFEPDRELAEEALNAYTGLQKHVFDRFTASIPKYPVSTCLLVGEPALRRRGAWSRRVKEIAETVTFATMANFSQYRDSVLRFRMLAN